MLTRPDKILGSRNIRHSVLCIFLIFLSGCFSTVIHPITGQDILFIESGTVVIKEGAPPICVAKSGCFFSDEYIDDIMKIKIKR